jgi:hypothetical protein
LIITPLGKYSPPEPTSWILATSPRIQFNMLVCVGLS